MKAALIAVGLVCVVATQASAQMAASPHHGGRRMWSTTPRPTVAPQCDANTRENIVQHGTYAAQVKLCHTTIARTKAKLDDVHYATDKLASVNDEAKDVNNKVEKLRKLWKVAEKPIKAIPKVGTVIAKVVDTTLRTAATVSSTVDKATTVFPKINEKIEVAVKGAERAESSSETWSDAAARVQTTLETASECGAACASGIVGNAATAAVGFYETPAIKTGLDTCTGELKDFNDAVDKFADNLKKILLEPLNKALKEFAKFVKTLTDEIQKFKDMVGKSVEEALCCSGLAHVGQFVGNVIDVVSCPIDGAMAAKGKLVNLALVEALRPLAAALTADLPKFDGLNLVSAKVVLYNELPAAARGCGLPARLAVSADVSVPALDLAVSNNGEKFDVEQIAYDVGEAFVNECKKAVEKVLKVGCSCPLFEKSYPNGAGEVQGRACPSGSKNAWAFWDDGKASGLPGPGYRCWKDVRKKVKPSHWPSTADRCIEGYEKKYSGLDFADRCWKETCKKKTRTCNITEGCCKFSWSKWQCTGKKVDRTCKTYGPYNNKWKPRYETVGVPLKPKQCRDGWMKDPSGLLCYPKCKSGYQMVGPMCWWKSEGRRLQQTIAAAQQQNAAPTAPTIRSLRGSARV